MSNIYSFYFIWIKYRSENKNFFLTYIQTQITKCLVNGNSVLPAASQVNNGIVQNHLLQFFLRRVFSQIPKMKSMKLLSTWSIMCKAFLKMSTSFVFLEDKQQIISHKKAEKTTKKTARILEMARVTRCCYR